MAINNYNTSYATRASSQPTGNPYPVVNGFQTNQYTNQDQFNQYQSNYAATKGYADFYGQQRDQDLAKGAAVGNQQYGIGSLGRIDTSAYNNVANIASSRLGGYTSGEWGGLRNQAMLDSSRQFAGADQQLAAQRAQSGIRGASAMAAQQHEDRNRNNAILGNNRNLMLANIGAKQQALQQYQGALGAQTQVQEYNLGQLGKEKQGQSAYQLGYAQLGAADRAAAGRMVAQDTANAENAQATKKEGSKF